MYFTDRGIEELRERRGDEQVSLDWLGRAAADLRRRSTRSSRSPVDRLATWLARADDEDD